MATVSFDKNFVIEEPEAVTMLVESLLNDKPREISNDVVTLKEIEGGEQLLRQCLSRSKN